MDRVSWRKVYSIIDGIFNETDITITVYLIPSNEEVMEVEERDEQEAIQSVTWPNLWDDTDSRTVYTPKFGWLSSLEDVPFPERDVYSWRPTYLRSCPTITTILDPQMASCSRSEGSGRHGKDIYHVPPGY